MFESAEAYQNEAVVGGLNMPAAWLPSVDSGRGGGYVPRNYAAQPYGSLPFAAPFSGRVHPRNEWQDLAEELERTGSLLSQIIARRNYAASNQANTNYCWFHGVSNGDRALRAKAGLPDNHPSPASGAAQIKRGRNEGGNGIDALEWMIENGINTLDEWPENSRDLRHATPENAALAKGRRVQEWWDVEPDEDVVFSLLLDRIPVAAGYNWWGHLIVLLDPIFKNGKPNARGWNSWSPDWPQQGANGLFTFDGRKWIPDDCVAPRVAMA